MLLKGAVLRKRPYILQKSSYTIQNTTILLFIYQRSYIIVFFLQKSLLLVRSHLAEMNQLKSVVCVSNVVEVSKGLESEFERRFEKTVGSLSNSPGFLRQEVQ